MRLGLVPSLSAAARGKIGHLNTPQEPPLVLLGLDSLSQHDDLALLKSWSMETAASGIQNWFPWFADRLGLDEFVDTSRSMGF